MRAGGMTEQEIEAATKQAPEIASRVPTAKISKVLEDAKDLRSVLTHKEEAPALLEDVTRIEPQ